jgi:hypothetical protein
MGIVLLVSSVLRSNAQGSTFDLWKQAGPNYGSGICFIFAIGLGCVDEWKFIPAALASEASGQRGHSSGHSKRARA